MKHLTVLAASTALAILMGSAAQATDGNEAYIDQLGSGNDALIEQGGSDNQAGTATLRMRQGANRSGSVADGDDNALTIVQSGDLNEIGTSTGLSAGQIPNNQGVNQVGDLNAASVTQSTDGNRVNQLLQTATGAATFTGPTKNDLTIVQSGTTGGNRIVSARQSKTLDGAGNSGIITQSGNNNAIGQATNLGNGFTQEGAANQATITQSSNGNNITGFLQSGIGNIATLGQGAGNSNSIYSVSQRNDAAGNANTATVTMSGPSNFIDYVSQDSRLAGSGNQATITIEGFSNGSGNDQLTKAAAASGALASDFRQTGGGNVIGFAITGTGDDNLFGITQIGTTNSADGVTISGDRNQLGVFQDGTSNDFWLATIAGDDNNVGLRQGGNLNFATLTVDGNSNDGDFRQASNAVGNDIVASIVGNFNDLTIDQSVGSSPNANSVADVAITGDSNVLDVQQNAVRSAGGPQTVRVTIQGSNNNNLASIGSGFGGVALSVGLTPGTIVQDKNGSEATLDVIGNGNLFAFEQSGNPGGSITGTITGDANQAAVSQIGAENHTVFAQTGNNNNLGITQ